MCTSRVSVFFAVLSVVAVSFTSCASGAAPRQKRYTTLSTPERSAQQKETPPVVQEGPLEITIEDAVLTALKNNRALKVEQFSPAIRKTLEEEQRALFDPVITAGATQSRDRTVSPASDTTTNSTRANAGISQFFPTGTRVGGEVSGSRTKSSSADSDYGTQAAVTVTQPLLQGLGVSVNRASLRQAEIDTLSSGYELRGFVESLVAQTEATYWDVVLAERQLEIFTDSLKLAQQQLDETSERIKVGKLAETELAAAQAEVALRRQDLIDARSSLAKSRLQAARLLNPPGKDPLSREIILLTSPAVPELKLDDVANYVNVALRMRPDLNQAKLSAQRGELEVVKTKNGLLPRLDFFISLGKTGYADSFSGSVSDIDGKSYDASAGLSFEFPLTNRSAIASHTRAQLSNERAVAAIENLSQLVQVDVMSAYIELTRGLEQVTATAATRALQEEKLRAETEKFRVGRSTSFLVAQAQRDLVAARVSEIRAVVTCLKALVELYRLEGTLLDRHGISAPGSKPVGVRGE